MHQHNPANLDSLPRELHYLIFDLLDYGTSISLSQTSRLFRTTVSPQKCTTIDKQIFVFRAERFQSIRRQSMLGCYYCYRVLPSLEFSDYDHVPTRHDPNGILEPRACFGCSVRERLLVEGDAERVGGKSVHLCRGCLQLKEGRFCTDRQWCEQCLFEKLCRDFVFGKVHCAWCKDTFRLRLGRGKEDQLKPEGRGHWTVLMWIHWLVFFEWVVFFEQWCREPWKFQEMAALM